MQASYNLSDIALLVDFFSVQYLQAVYSKWLVPLLGLCIAPAFPKSC